MLFTLDRRPLEAALQQAEANLERDIAQAANAKAQRASAIEDLAERGIATREQVDTARASAAALEATLAADRAAVENAKVQLQYATITRADLGPHRRADGATPATWCAPTTRRRSSPSTRSRRSTSSFALPEARLPELKRYMAQRHAARRGDGRRTTTDRVAVGRITFIDNAVDQTTGTIKVKGDVPERRSPALARPVRQRRRSRWRPIRTRSSCRPSRCRPASRATYVFVVKADQTVELRPVDDRARRRAAETVISEGLHAGRDGRDRRPPAAGPRQPRQRQGRRGREGGAMNLSALFIKRPVTTTLIMLGIIVFGVMAYRQLPVSDLPTVDFPTIQVQAGLPGASPETMASSVALPLEKQFATIAGLDSINSTSYAGQHQHHAAVRPEPQHRRRRAGRAGDDRAGRRGSCRRRCRRRRRTRRSIPADQPVIFLVLRSATLPLLDRQRVRRDDHRAAHLDGQRRRAGAGVRRRRSTRCAIDVDPRKLAAHGIGIDEVATAISERQRQPADRHDLRRRQRPSPCWPTASCCGPAAYGPMIIAYRNGNPVRLDEVAHVYDGVENDKSADWYRGRAQHLPRRSRSSRAPTSSRSSTRSRRCCRRSASSCRRRSRSTSAPIARCRSASRCTTSS